MKIQPLLLFILFFNFQFLFSQDLGLSVLTIPDSLKQNANSVVRFYNTNIELVSHKKMIIKVKKAVTVLNKMGDGNKYVAVGYDKNRRIKKIKTIIYNNLGSEIKKVNNKEYKDVSRVDGGTLYADSRMLYYEHVPISYPYTIYYEYELESTNTAFIRKWMPINSYNQSVEQNTYKITFSNDLTLQKKEKKFEKYPIKKSSNIGSLLYEINGISAIKYEDLGPSITSIMPSVKFAPNKFSIEGLEGEADNWKKLGKWEYNNFYKDINQLPSSTKEQIRQLVSGVKTPLEKAKIIYKYVQDKTRYISVQVGIGSLKPMLASDVDRLGYGDCKALTNYTKSLLDVVGVESYFTELYGDSQKLDMDYDLPSIQGNHVILNLPIESGDIWLECTSQTVPFGYIANFTDDRDVIVITPEGGILKHTGIYNDKNNFQKTLSNYKLTSKGNIEADIVISSGGIQYDDHYSLQKKSKKDIENYYKSNYWSYINDLSIDDYSFTNNKDSIIFKEKVKIKATDYATFSGDRMLFAINTFNQVSDIPKRYRNRKLPLEIARGFIDKDLFEITLPNDYIIEAIPESIKIENKFGLYQFSVEKISLTKLKYSRTFYLKKGLYPATEYKNYRNFRKQVAKLDKSKIVLIKK